MKQDIKREAEARRKKDLVREVQEDFAARREMRRHLERGWELNMNFVSGKTRRIENHEKITR